MKAIKGEVTAAQVRMRNESETSVYYSVSFNSSCPTRSLTKKHASKREREPQQQRPRMRRPPSSSPEARRVLTRPPPKLGCNLGPHARSTGGEEGGGFGRRGRWGVVERVDLVGCRLVGVVAEVLGRATANHAGGLRVHR